MPDHRQKSGEKVAAGEEDGKEEVRGGEVSYAVKKKSETREESEKKDKGLAAGEE
jgi:hypothetical protein